MQPYDFPTPLIPTGLQMNRNQTSILGDYRSRLGKKQETIKKLALFFFLDLSPSLAKHPDVGSQIPYGEDVGGELV